MTEMLPDEDEFTELTGAVIPRIDLVGKGATGMPFLIAKGANDGGLLSADQVRGLIGEEPVSKGSDQVTLSGSAAAIAAMIHNAPVRKADAPPNEKGPQMTDDVTKADDPAVEVGDLVADAPGGSSAESLPGSPDWEQLDADTALNAISVLARVKGALGWLADREATEVVTGGDDDGDVNSVFDLEDAACQIDCIIRRLAGFAVTEQIEAEVDAELDGITKAFLGEGVVPALSVLESFGPVRKAGRVLSSANEAAIRAASDSLQKVLASLPAPITDDGAAVAKSEEIPVETAVEKAADAEAPADATSAAEPAAEVAKAKGDPMVAVYDESGKLVGTVDQADISPIASASAPEGGDAVAADAPADPDDAAAAVDPDAPVAAAPDAAEQGATIPGTETVASPPPAQDDDAVAKAVRAEIGSALAEVLTPLVEQLGAHAELTDVVKGLQERVEKMAALPDDRRSPILNGATGSPLLADRDGSLVDPLADLKKAAAEETDPGKQNDAKAKLAHAELMLRFSNR